MAYKGPTWVHQNSGSLPKAEVFDAEARGAAEGLQWAREECQKGRRPPKVVLCIDNTPVIRGIEGHTPLSSQGYFQSIKSNQRWLEVFLVKLETRWTPGHVGILGNEAADQLAKKATLLTREEQQLATVSWARRQNWQERKQMFADWWAKNCPPSYQHLDLAVGKGNPELTLTRRMLHRLLAERTGHGDFAEYHRRFNHEDADTRCGCGEEKSQWHFISCRRAAGWKHPRPPRDVGKIQNILGPRGWLLFKSLVEETGVYEKARGESLAAVRNT